MLDINYSSISFGAKFDSKASERLLDSVKHCRGLKLGVEARLAHIREWGNPDSVILLSKDKTTSAERFVLKNDKFGDKEVAISKQIDSGWHSIVMAFFDVTKNAINQAEKILMKG